MMQPRRSEFTFPRLLGRQSQMAHHCAEGASVPAAAVAAAKCIDLSDKQPSDDQASLSTASSDGFSWGASPRTSSPAFDLDELPANLGNPMKVELPQSYAPGGDQQRPRIPGGQLLISPPPGLCLSPPVLSTAPEFQAFHTGTCSPPARGRAAACADEVAQGSQFNLVHYALWREALAAASATAAEYQYEQHKRQQAALLQMSLGLALQASPTHAAAKSCAVSWPTPQRHEQLGQHEQWPQHPEQHHAQQHEPKQLRRQKQGKGSSSAYTCKFIFTGIDLARDVDFDLVPRLIGRQGHNTRSIAKISDGKVRIRGRGSQHLEPCSGSGGLQEADVPLQITLSTQSREGFELGKAELQTLLEGITSHFTRYCHRKGLHPVPQLYSEGS
ncbi:unnamed protein product [Polarella glacialis]|uniref:KHDC4/BBP-like KH-domain type I domain-containing protein n=1 Tax=Polarella glacialis TaxID=89957 RepID=A0A813KZC4_POLGL|nr:unnamed protein product [Polarella glacialis]